ncbi:MAG: hypothetical protein JWN32_499 [Solirubrobacterales bacterium]|nr:hypothetical protein [Solirubrobacterales bacterium]
MGGWNGGGPICVRPVPASDAGGERIAPAENTRRWTGRGRGRVVEVGDAGDVSKRLGELVALAADLGALRGAIAELDRQGAGELLLAAVLGVAALQEGEARAADLDESRAGDAEELPVADPFVDPAAPYAAMLDAARQLRMALVDQPDLPAVVNATRALSADENALIVLELAFESWYERTRGGGAGAERGDGGDG